MKTRLAAAFKSLPTSQSIALSLMASGILQAWAGLNSDTDISNPAGQDYLVQLIGGLAVVLLSILALAWMLKKLNRLPNKGQSDLEIVATLSVGQREKLVIVRSGEVELLLGIAPGSVAKLHVLSGESGNSASQSKHSDFASLMPDPQGAGRR